MKKTLLAVIMGIVMITFASCGGSSTVDKAKKVLDDVMENVNKATTCDDVDMAAFGILGLLSVDGIENLTEAEQQELDAYTEKISKAVEEKKAALDCKDDFWFDDEEVPADEPAEVE